MKNEDYKKNWEGVALTIIPNQHGGTGVKDTSDYTAEELEKARSDFRRSHYIGNLMVSLDRDLPSDIPDWIDRDEFLKFHACNKALRRASTIYIENPSVRFRNDVEGGVYSKFSPEDLANLREDVMRQSKAWRDAPSRSILYLCINCLDDYDIENNDRECAEYCTLHREFRVFTGFDFNDIYMFFHDLSKRVIEKPKSYNEDGKPADKTVWSYLDWVNCTAVDAWGGSKYIDMLTLYARLEIMLPSERTDRFLQKFV